MRTESILIVFYYLYIFFYSAYYEIWISKTIRCWLRYTDAFWLFPLASNRPRQLFSTKYVLRELVRSTLVRHLLAWKNASTTQTRQRIPRTRNMWQDIRMDEVGKVVTLVEHVEWVCLMTKHYSSQVMILLAYCRTELTSGLCSFMLIYMYRFYLYVL